MPCISTTNALNRAFNADLSRPAQQRKFLPFIGIHNESSTRTAAPICQDRTVNNRHCIAAHSAAWDEVIEASGMTGAKRAELAQELKQVVVSANAATPASRRMTVLGALRAAVRQVREKGGMDAEEQASVDALSSKLDKQIRTIAEAYLKSEARDGTFTGRRKDEALSKEMKSSASLMKKCVTLMTADTVQDGIVEEIVAPSFADAVVEKRLADLQAMVASGKEVDVTSFLSAGFAGGSAARAERQLGGNDAEMTDAIMELLKLPAYVLGKHDEADAKPPDADAGPVRAADGQGPVGGNGYGSPQFHLAPIYHGPTYNNNADAMTGASKSESGSGDIRVDGQSLLGVIGQLISRIHNLEERLDKSQGELNNHLVAENERLKRALSSSASSSGYDSDRALSMTSGDEGRTLRMPEMSMQESPRELPATPQSALVQVAWDTPLPSPSPIRSTTGRPVERHDVDAVEPDRVSLASFQDLPPLESPALVKLVQQSHKGGGANEPIPPAVSGSKEGGPSQPRDSIKRTAAPDAVPATRLRTAGRVPSRAVTGSAAKGEWEAIVELRQHGSMELAGSDPDAPMLAASHVDALVKNQAEPALQATFNAMVSRKGASPEHRAPSPGLEDEVLTELWSSARVSSSKGVTPRSSPLIEGVKQRQKAFGMTPVDSGTSVVLSPPPISTVSRDTASTSPHGTPVSTTAKADPFDAWTRQDYQMSARARSGALVRPRFSTIRATEPLVPPPPPPPPPPRPQTLSIAGIGGTGNVKSDGPRHTSDVEHVRAKSAQGAAVEPQQATKRNNKPESAFLEELMNNPPVLKKGGVKVQQWQQNARATAP